jgi:hypothetical protein
MEELLITRPVKHEPDSCLLYSSQPRGILIYLWHKRNSPICRSLPPCLPNPMTYFIPDITMTWNVTTWLLDNSIHWLITLLATWSGTPDLLNNLTNWRLGSLTPLLLAIWSFYLLIHGIPEKLLPLSSWPLWHIHCSITMWLVDLLMPLSPFPPLAPLTHWLVDIVSPWLINELMTWWLDSLTSFRVDLLTPWLQHALTHCHIDSLTHLFFCLLTPWCHISLNFWLFDI